MICWLARRRGAASLRETNLRDLRSDLRNLRENLRDSLFPFTSSLLAFIFYLLPAPSYLSLFILRYQFSIFDSLLTPNFFRSFLLILSHEHFHDQGY